VGCFDWEPLRPRSWQNFKAQLYEVLLSMEMAITVNSNEVMLGYETFYTTDTFLNIRAEKEFKKASQTIPNCPLI